VERVRGGRVRVLVLGAAKRGKSTLVNALFGAPLLPTGVVPVTAVMTVVRVDATLRAEVRYRDGRIVEVDPGRVEELVSEQGNPGNARGVDRVLVTAPSPYLTDGTEVVDTPGVGSIHQANTDEAHRSLVTMDVAVLVVAADPPISAADLALLEQARATTARTVVVVNKADRAIPPSCGRSPGSPPALSPTASASRCRCSPCPHCPTRTPEARTGSRSGWPRRSARQQAPWVSAPRCGLCVGRSRCWRTPSRCDGRYCAATATPGSRPSRR
jgi:hypothetical protein